MSIKETEIVCIGSIVADIFLFGIDSLPLPGALEIAKGAQLYPGGCATNTSIAFTKLGGKARLIGRVGDDHLGSLVINHLKQKNVVTGSIKISAGSTAINVAIVFANGERTFLYYPGCNSLLSKDDIEVEVLSKSRLVHFSDTFLLPGLDGEGTHTLLQAAREDNIKTSMATSWDAEGRWLTLIRKSLPFVDLYFCNHVEAQALTGYKNPEDSSLFLLGCGVAMVIVTLGGQGSLIRTSDFLLKIPAFNVDVVDTTGAGDCYVAAYLYGFLQGWDVEKVGTFASALGAMCITRVGATTSIHSSEEVLAFMQEATHR
ncbi:MAG: carbohydrate kinase family protein [Burkholderiaceae bacterium]|nr:carbohydrate kinase family protein [Burkholderiaceae bacterium]